MHGYGDRIYCEKQLYSVKSRYKPITIVNNRKIIKKTLDFNDYLS